MCNYISISNAKTKKNWILTVNIFGASNPSLPISIEAEGLSLKTDLSTQDPKPLQSSLGIG